MEKFKDREVIRWGIIGCGNVTEVKSGPAFYKIKNSELTAVMRRDEKKAADYAKRHHVPKWYTSVRKLIKDPDVDIVYIATPPDTHAKYAIDVMQAGKPVYVEKPMARNFNECLHMIEASEKYDVPIYVAYYRRALDYFLKIKELLDKNTIGKIRCVNIKFYHEYNKNELLQNKLPWRVNPIIAGGGLFFDLASHQLDLLDFLFGPIEKVNSIVRNQAGLYKAEDIVAAQFQFNKGIIGSGLWCFTVNKAANTDEIEIVGEEGKISFSTFLYTPVIVDTSTKTFKYNFKRPAHIQQNLIETIIDDLQCKSKCHSTGYTASRTNRIMDEIVKKYYNGTME